MPIVGTIGAAAAAGAATAAKGTGIWAGIRAGAAAIGRFLVANSKPIATGVAVAGTALVGGSYSNGDMKISYKKGLLDKAKSASSVQPKSTRTNSAQSQSHNSNSVHNQSKKQSWSHSGTYKKRR